MNIELIKDLKKNYKYHTAAFFAQKYGIQACVIHKTLKKNNIYKDKAGLWKQQEGDIIADYNRGKPLSVLGNKYKHTETDIRNLLIRNGVKIRSATAHAVHHKYDEAFFKKIDSNEKAYWLGFIAADGNVYSKKFGRTFQVCLAKRDKEHVYKLRKSLGSTHKILKDRECIRLCISRKALCEDLEKLGISERKSLTLEFPCWLSKELVPAYIRGYFDGDGWIVQCGGQCWTIGLIATKTFIDTIKRILEKSKIYSVVSQEKRKAQGKLWYLRICGSMSGNTKNSLAHIYKYLYNGGTSLDRKHKKILQILRNE